MPDPLTPERIAEMREYINEAVRNRPWDGMVSHLASHVRTLAAEVERLRTECNAARELLNHVADAPLKVDILKSQQEHLITERDRLASENAELRAAIQDAYRRWSFSSTQQHTHTWHDRADWIAAHPIIHDLIRAAELLARTPTASVCSACGGQGWYFTDCSAEPYQVEACPVCRPPTASADAPKGGDV